MRSRLARAGGGPTLIEAKVTRLTGALVRRPADEIPLRGGAGDRPANDPLPRFREQLRDAGVLTDEIEARLTAEITAAVEDATEYAEDQPDPDPAIADALRLRRGSGGTG